MSESNVERVDPSGLRAQRRPYEKPALIIYGKIEEMTRSGTGSKKEVPPVSKPRP
jgi:hypothetical protein